MAVGSSIVSLLGVERETLLERAPDMPKIKLRPREVSDLEMIANGAFSPLEGFMCEDDYTAVRGNKHLVSGLPWTIPVTLSASDDFASGFTEGTDIALYSGDDHLLGVLHLRQKFRYDKQREAERVYLTTDLAHPGVAALYEQGDWLLGGPVSLLNRPRNSAFPTYRLDPAETRDEFEKKGWRRVVAFQTRNPDSPSARIHHQMRARNRRRTPASPARRRNEIRRHTRRCSYALLRSDARTLLSAHAHAAWPSTLRRCDTRGRAKLSFAPSSERITAARIS